MPAQIAFSYPVVEVGGDVKERSYSSSSMTSSSYRAQRSSSFGSERASTDYIMLPVDSLFPPVETHERSSPLSLVQLCLRTLCHFTKDWILPDGTSKINLSILPPDIMNMLFEMVRKHRLLREDLLPAFHRCEIVAINLAQYPGVTDSWLPDLTLIRCLKSIDLSHCKCVTDEGFRTLAVLGYGKGRLDTLILECCVALTDASVAFVVHALSKSLKVLNVSGCVRLTDATLARVLLAKNLRALYLNRCQLMTPEYLSQIGLLTKLRVLDLGLIPSVNDTVLSAFRPCSRPGAPYVVSAVEECYASSHRGHRRRGDGSNTTSELDSDEDDDVLFDSVSEESDREDEPNMFPDSDTELEGSCLQGGATAEKENDIMESTGVDGHNRFLKRMLRPLKPRNVQARYRTTLQKLSPRRQRSSGVLQQSVHYHPNRANENTQLLRDTNTLDGRHALLKSWTTGSSDSCKQNSEILSLRLEQSRSTKSGLKYLEELNVGYCKVTDQGCVSISKLRRLSFLVLKQNEITRKAVEYLIRLPKLQYLDVAHCGQLGRSAQQLACIPTLEVLDLSFVPVSSFDRCRDYENLHEINLSNTTIDFQTLEILSNQARNLSTLKLEGCRVSDHGFYTIENLTKLQVLDLGETDVTDDAMKKIGTLTQLRELNLFQCNITEYGLRMIASKLVNLERLNLDTAETGDSFLKSIAPMQSLRHLDLFGAKITDQGCSELAKANLPHLESIEICGGYITDRGVASIAKINSKLFRINLSQNASITDQGVKRLAEAFGMSLRSLALSNTRITKHSVTLFYSFVFLEELVVRGCRIGSLTGLESLPNLW
eukprot:CAMPEP_0203789022 /NCGR_PEP_ID=MMETSP0100_2-20121128/3182_1 /ASSEMBLY_ACC=CAM_ASM_000210 /TAXON_ID=96639 /ORGANISM=" , Strain NY0313808BC1" /LENGTH=826 /DNA_ID=CAMNT_0050691851 /DNA_START=247 /DNA_END=2724 /DNA_ORIENTATION=+